MTILHVQVRDPKTDNTLFGEYVEIPTVEPREVVREALSRAYLSYSIKQGKPQEMQVKRDDIVSMYVDKLMSTAQIAHALGTSDTVIANFLRKNGVKLRNPGKQALTASPEMETAVARLYTVERKTMGQISAETGLTLHHVRRILHEKSVTMRTGRPANTAESSSGALR